MRSILWCVVAVSVVSFAGDAIAEEKAVPLDKLPKTVTEAIKKMFPKAELIEATQDEEDGDVEYEVTVKENGKRIDITVEADGKIEALEKEIDLKDLPKAVVDALEKKYPKAAHKSAEAVFEVEDGKEELEYYEVQIKTADNQEVEVKIKADGKIVKNKDEDKGDAQPPK